MLGIPERNENRIRASQANAILKAKAKRKTPIHDAKVKRKYRSVSSFTSGRCFFKADIIHLNNVGLNDIRNLITGQILYSKYNKELNNVGSLKVYTVNLTAVDVQVPAEINPITVDSPKVPSRTIGELTLSSPPICALVFQRYPQVPPDKSKPSAFCLFPLVGYKT